jgi:hypothetical protein
MGGIWSGRGGHAQWIQNCTLGRRLTTYATYYRPHLRPQKNEQINTKPGCATEDITNQNLIQEKIKRRLNPGNACCHSVQNLLSSRLLSKNIKVIIYKTIILPVVLYGCETWSLTLREEHRHRLKKVTIFTCGVPSPTSWELFVLKCFYVIGLC